MEARGPSRTAIQVAIRRAAHHLLDDDPKILSDPFARAFAGFATDDALLDALGKLPLGDVPWMRAPFVLRNRYAEDELARAFRKGISQYVILGAGLDSFAYRRPEFMRTLDIFEVDHPASQAWKRGRVAELGIPVPATLQYVAVDFETATLTEGLTSAGVNLGAPAFFSWLGVTQYLTPETVLGTLREIATIGAAGTEVAVQFMPPATTLSNDEAGLLTALATGAAKVGEPWLSFFEPRELTNHLHKMGYRDITHFGPQEAWATYLAGRKDGMRAPEYFRMVKAELG
jgi:methyltransferase (TIGR00027 family)